MLKYSNYILSSIGAALFMALTLSPADSMHFGINAGDINFFLTDTIPNDTIDKDSINKKDARYAPSRSATYQPRDRFGDPFTNPPEKSPLILKDPGTLKLGVKLDSNMNYTIHENVGELQYRPTTSLTFDQFSMQQDREMLKGYWKSRSSDLDGESAVSGRSLIPPIYVSPVFDRIFGGSYVDIRPNGFVQLDFGGRWQRINNPAMPVRMQRNGGFNFDQQISANIVGKIGEKLQVMANFDNNNTFDFENNLKVEYTGFEEEIIKKIEIGNVSLPLNNSLMSGAQNLFGVKTQLQFGKLYITALASTQRGRTESIVIEGGSQGKEFELRSSDYDENRHFFLGHFFRDNYQNWLRSMPQITSGINITRVEVYIMNRNKSTETLRNIAAFMDLGEKNRIHNTTAVSTSPSGTAATDNNANNLMGQLKSLNTRHANELGDALTNLFGEGSRTRDYDVINGARKLDEREFSFHRQLGYISLQRKLQSDEVLAVAFEYTHNGQVYKVGELMEDYQNRQDNEVIFLKMLRPTRINTEVPTWDLMMKNIYSLNANQITREGFELRILYRDDRRGIDNPSLHEGNLDIKDRPLVEVLGLDRLNQMNDPQPDGIFDYVEGITIDPMMGNIIFPVLEPFGTELRTKFREDTERNLINTYVYDELYNSTKADAELNASKNKFIIRGRFSAGSTSEIALPGFNVSPGSVRVIAGGTPLTEGLDYTVDYTLNTVRILNQGIMNSGKQINITFEKADMFNFQTRSLVGTRADYRVSDDLNIGATMLYLYERPLVSRVSIGDEPTSNLKYGFDINWRKDSRFLTKLVDALPLIQTKEMSTINFYGEFAQLIPGTSNIVDGEGTSYIDDFEAAVTPFSLGGSSFEWKLAATPETEDRPYFISKEGEGKIGYGYKRAKLAWYTIDNIFYRTGGPNAPRNITEDDIKNHYVRAVPQQEIAPEFQLEIIPFPEPTLDLAFFPNERGMYNYNPSLNADGHLASSPEQNWGGVTRAIKTEVDFDRNNIEYLEFWMMDPFIDGENGKILDGFFNKNNTTGGELVFNLGSVSEDLIKDGRHSFENGLPPNYENVGDVERNEWGRVPNRQYLNDAFDNSTSARPNQDVGLDGVRNDDEPNVFKGFLDQLSGLNPSALEKIRDDVSADNFQHFLNEQHDQNDHKILQRYKNFNGMDGNSPIANSTSQISESANHLPDNEDLNGDNTISDLEEYYEYKLNLKPNQLGVGKEHIVDEVVNEVNGDRVRWYLFRIPVRQPDKYHGDIQGFKSIRYVRAYLTGFREPVVLRLAKMKLVGSQWRKYEGSLYEKGFDQIPEPYDPNFTVGVVGIEENSQGSETKTPYVLPPGFVRDRDNTSIRNRQVNEQSLLLCVDDLKNKDARAVYKNVSLDMINYGRIKMFLHADSELSQDEEVTAFIRLGTDFVENYYEIEVPLKMTPMGTRDPRAVWPLENEIDVRFEELFITKSQRDRAGTSMDLPYSRSYNQYKITIEGRPEISTVRTIMIGIRNPNTQDESPKSVCIWANELRLADFDTESGWAANARLNAKLADFADVTASTRYSTYGFGDIQQRISERSREEILQFDVSANVTMDKFLPEKWGIKIPMFVSYESMRITPRFDPRDNDIPLEAVLLGMENDSDRAKYRDIVTDQSTRRSINFSNVRKIKIKQDAKKRIYDIENLSFTLALSEMKRSNFNTESYLLTTQRVGLAYNFTPDEISFEPFKNWGVFSSPYFRLLKDFNISPMPNTLSARGDLDRRFVRTQYRNAELSTVGVPPNFEKYFTFNRMYNLRWNLTKSLAVDYSARANAIIDEPDGDLDSKAKQQEVINNIMGFGRMKNFDQNIGITYRVPFDKLPFTDWLAADARYGASYNWMAGAYNPYGISQQDTLGNIIQNRREQNITGKIDMVKLYNKVKVLRNINNPPKRARPSLNQRSNNQNKKEDAPPAISENKAFTSILKLLMAVKSINITYGLTEGTMLPGFMLQPHLLGMDKAFIAPGLPFILGSQDGAIRYDAANNGWIASSPYQTTPFGQTQMEDINIRVNVEPFGDMRITLDARRQKAGNYQEIFRKDTVSGGYSSITPSLSGNYNITIFSLKTAFRGNNSENINETFRQFEQNRAVIRDRLNVQDQTETGFDQNSQDVLLPAFMAAYTGKDANNASLNPFPKIPIPNWRVDYAGLGKIPALAEIFSSISITHGYNSMYNVGNFTNSLMYNDSDISLSDLGNFRPAYITDTATNQLIPLYIMNQVSIIERFAPLIGINVRTKSKITARIEYKTERNIGLSLSNAQVTEMTNNDIVMDVGYTKANMKLPFRMDGRTVVLKNDITFRLGFTVRDTETVQRKLDDSPHTITMGNLNFQLRPTVNYMVNEKLNLQLYFDRNINRPKVANQFLRASTAFGVQVRFSLAQ